MGILTVLGLVPLVGSVVVAFLPSGQPAVAKRVALMVATATFAIAVVLAIAYDAGSTQAFQFVETHQWIPTLGITYSVGVDGIGLVLILLATLLVPIVIMVGWNDVEVTAGLSNGSQPQGSVKGYFALMLVLEAFVIGVFASLDVLLFYVFFEAVLIPVYFMIGRYGTGRRAYAAIRFLIYSLVGGLVMLAALAVLWYVSLQAFGYPTMYLPDLLSIEIDPTLQGWLFWGFFLAFAIKAPLWPLHSWLPSASGSATPGTAALLIGVLDKIGTFGMLRLALPLFPEASQSFAPIVIAMAVIGIFYGALVAIGQKDIKRLFGYVSLSHFGFITLGIFVFTSQGQSGSAFYMLGHGISTALLFGVLGYMIARRRSSLVADFGGVNKVAPVLAGFFLVAGLSALALPGMMTFLSEFLVLVGTFSRYPWLGAAATVAIILASLYVLLLYQRTMTGAPAESVKGMHDLSGREKWALAPLMALMIVLGFFPGPVLEVINPAVRTTMEWVGVTDPPHPVQADSLGRVEP
ncbi:MAG: NADH-quinone oxidoreductase subunit M [Candidatus Nanopelagicales bacterium]|nr:NADH-quinone oxidoreductase subunit M [Candidatus Nanopelagicales bacterium]MDZ4250584.1 NADH-quinone oxidoreductase subunit M [Candidatus Nanopelagicales bacterium]